MATPVITSREITPQEALRRQALRERMLLEEFRRNEALKNAANIDRAAGKQAAEAYLEGKPSPSAGRQQIGEAVRKEFRTNPTAIDDAFVRGEQAAARASSATKAEEFLAKKAAQGALKTPGALAQGAARAAASGAASAGKLAALKTAGAWLGKRFLGPAAAIADVATIAAAGSKFRDMLKSMDEADQSYEDLNKAQQDFYAGQTEEAREKRLRGMAEKLGRSPEETEAFIARNKAERAAKNAPARPVEMQMGTEYEEGISPQADTPAPPKAEPQAQPVSSAPSPQAQPNRIVRTPYGDIEMTAEQAARDDRDPRYQNTDTRYVINTEKLRQGRQAAMEADRKNFPAGEAGDKAFAKKWDRPEYRSIIDQPSAVSPGYTGKTGADTPDWFKAYQNRSVSISGGGSGISNQERASRILQNQSTRERLQYRKDMGTSRGIPANLTKEEADAQVAADVARNRAAAEAIKGRATQFGGMADEAGVVTKGAPPAPAGRVSTLEEDLEELLKRRKKTNEPTSISAD